MSDQTFDRGFEARLRDALKAEAATIPMTLRADQVLDRARARQKFHSPWSLRERRFGQPRTGFQRLSFAIAASAVAVVIAIAGVAGLNFLLDQRPIIGPSRTAEPSPTASPSDAPSPTPVQSVDPRPTAPSSGGMWPQSNLAEVQDAQRLADEGDPAYTWQVDPALVQEKSRAWMHLVEDQPQIVDRFVREVLGWEKYMVNVYPGRADDNGAADGVYGDIGYLRCAPDPANPFERGDTCDPSLDETRYETVSIDLAQLDRHGPDGIWVVNDWSNTAPYAPVTEVRPLFESFLRARIDGHGAEGLIEADAGVPLLYGTSTGAPYERFEMELVQGPIWGAGYIDFIVRLFADNGQTVVEQRMRWVYWSPGLPTLSAATTTENGQPVSVRYEFLDGKLTAFAPYPWEPSCGDDCLGWSQGTASGNMELAVSTHAAAIECLDGATDPLSVNVGGIPAQAMDGTGAVDCQLADYWLGRGRPLRVYLIDLPAGSSVRTILITLIAGTGTPLHDVIEAATPILEAIDFHLQ